MASESSLDLRFSPRCQILSSQLLIHSWFALISFAFQSKEEIYISHTVKTEQRPRLKIKPGGRRSYPVLCPHLLPCFFKESKTWFLITFPHKVYDLWAAKPILRMVSISAGTRRPWNEITCLFTANEVWCKRINLLAPVQYLQTSKAILYVICTLLDFTDAFISKRMAKSLIQEQHTYEKHRNSSSENTKAEVRMLIITFRPAFRKPTYLPALQWQIKSHVWAGHSLLFNWGRVAMKIWGA